MIPKGWRECVLGSCIDIKHGFPFQGEFFTREPTNFVVLTPGNFHIDKKLYFGKNTNYYTRDDAPTDYILENGDLLVVMTDLTKEMNILGNAVILQSDKKVLHNQRIGKIIVLNKKQVDKKFLCYLLNSDLIRNHIKATASGSTVRHTSPNRILEVTVNLPPKNEQEKIAKILSTWDEAIEKLEKLIAKKQIRLLGISQLLKCLAQEEGDEFTFEELFDIKIGGTPSRSKPEYWGLETGNSHPWISISDLKSKYISRTSERISDLGVEKSNVKSIKSGTVIMSFKLSIGRKAIVQVDSFTNEAIAAFEIIDPKKISNLYFYHALNWVRLDAEVDEAIKGKTLNKDKLKRLTLIVPSPERQSMIVEVFEVMDKEIEQLNLMLNSIKKQKQGFMQQLLTGKKRVKV
jgi:type I restriction enzyme S subunit